MKPVEFNKRLNEPVTSSYVLSDKLNIQHRSICDDIKKYKKQLIKLGIIAVETHKLKRGKGRPHNIYFLNLAQFTFIMSKIRARTDVNADLVNEARK